MRKNITIADNDFKIIKELEEITDVKDTQLILLILKAQIYGQSLYALINNYKKYQ